MKINKRLSISKVCTRILLITIAIYYIYYKTDKFLSQPILLNSLRFTPFEPLPLPGFLICNDGMKLNVTLDSGGKQQILPESDLKLKSNEVPLTCYIWNKVDEIVRKPVYNASLPFSGIDLRVFITPANTNLTANMTGEYIFSTFTPLSVLTEDYIQKSHCLEPIGPIQVSYNVERKNVIKNTKSSVFSTVGSSPEISTPNLYITSVVDKTINGAAIAFSVSGEFGYHESQEHIAISIFSIITDIATFVLSVITGVYIFLFGNSKYKTWGKMNILLGQVPNNHVRSGQDIYNVIDVFLDINKDF